jgi:hypothetical protein
MFIGYLHSDTMSWRTAERKRGGRILVQDIGGNILRLKACFEKIRLLNAALGDGRHFPE